MANINLEVSFPLEMTGAVRLVIYSVYLAKPGDPAKFQMNKHIVVSGINHPVKIHSFLEWYNDFGLLRDKMIRLGFVMLSPNKEDARELYCTFI